MTTKDEKIKAGIIKMKQDGASRSEIRDQLRLFNKLDKRISKLTKDQANLVLTLANHKANDLAAKMAADLIPEIIENLHEVYRSAMHDLNYSLNEINEIAFATLITMKSIKLSGGFEDMGTNKKQIEIEVRKMVMPLIQEGLKRNEIIDDVLFKIPTSTRSLIHRQIDSCIEELDIVAEDTVDVDKNKEIQEAAESIFEENKKNIKEVKKVDPPKSLKVIEQILDGKNGIYHVNEEGIRLKKETAYIDFKTREDLEEWIEEFKAVFDMSGK